MNVNCYPPKFIHDPKTSNIFMKRLYKGNRMPNRFASKKLCVTIAMVSALMVILIGIDLHALENTGESLPESPKDSAVPTSAYELQLNSFKVKANAKRFFDKLVKKGYEPFMVHIQNNETWFKVRLGPYSSKITADQIAVELKKKHNMDSLILLAGKIQSNPNVAKKTPPKKIAPENDGNSIDVVMSQFLVWLKAWQGKQLDSYFSFYSRSFENGGKPFKDWRQEQRKNLDEAQQIKVEVNDLEMLEKGDTIEMSFIENFQSKSFSDVRRKVLVWKKEKGVWKIIVESSEPA